MKRRVTPVVLLAVQDGDGKPVAAPLFVALPLSTEVLRRLRTLSQLCHRHHLDEVVTTQIGVELYWDFPPGSELEGVVDETSYWHAAGQLHYGELLGRRPHPEGGFQLKELLGYSVMVDIAELDNIHAQSILLDFVDRPEHDAVLGQPFACAAYERLVALRWLGHGARPPDEGEP